MPSSTIIFLNGPSSAGKTSIARELQQTLSEPFLHIGVDHFLSMIPRRYFGLDPAPGTPPAAGFGWVTGAGDQGQWFDIVVGPLGTRILWAAHHAIAALAHDGLNLIVDEVLLFPDMLRHYLEVLRDFDVLFAGVRCPLATLETRERLRGDRAVGQARGHHVRVHAHQLYDLEVDTAVLSPTDCAGAIVGRLDLGPPYRAFAELRSTLVPAQ